MKESSVESKLLNSLIRKGKKTLVIVVGTLFCAGFIWMIRIFLAAATNLHWLVGLVAALVLFVVMILVLKWIRNAQLTSREFGKYPRIGLALNLFLIVFLAIVVLATISDILFQQNLVQYSSINPITVSLLLDYYSWHLIDSIPIIQIWEVLGVYAPAKGEGFWAGFLLQVFRVLIIVYCIQIFLSKRGDFHNLLGMTRSLRQGMPERNIKRDLEGARRHLDQAMSIASRKGIRIHKIDAILEYAQLFFELGKKDEVKKNLSEARKQIELESKDRDLDARQRKVQELLDKLEG